MHHKKKRKLFVLYSIPIINNLCNKFNRKKYLVSYSIPLSCMVVLLLGGVVMVNPELGDLFVGKTNAVTIQDEWVVTDSSSNNSDSSVNSDSPDEEFGGFADDDPSNYLTNENNTSNSDNDSNGNDGISLQSVVPTPTLAITIGNADQVIQAVQGGDTVYGSYNVSITGSNIKDYTLSIKADSTNLTMPSNANSSTSTVTGAGGKTGSTMGTNTWGYKLTETSTTESSYGSLAYASLPTTATQIANGTIASPYNLSSNKKLVFAAKFADAASPGNYTSKITLGLIATPAQTGQVWSNGVPAYITDMQDISSGFCKNNSKIAEGDTIELKDSRDTNVYTIYKAADGNCWMGQNLALTGPKTLASEDTDLASGTTWNLPASVTSWNTSDYNTVRIRTGSTSLTNWKNGYGNYYSWPAATAGTVTTSVTDNDASSSICPKGWKLPTYSGDYSFQTLTNTKSAWTTAGVWNGLTSVPGYYFGSTKTTLYKGANFWLAAGYVSQTSGALGIAGSRGFYWSRRAYSSTNYAYYLTFLSGDVNPQDFNSRYYGFSVRCVASY